MAPSLVLPTEYGRILSHSDCLFWRSTSSVSWTGTSVSALGPSAAAPQASTVYAPPLQPGASLSSLSATQPFGMQSGLAADTPVVKKVSGVSSFLSSLICKYLTPFGSTNLAPSPEACSRITCGSNAVMKSCPNEALQCTGHKYIKIHV